MMEQPSAQLLDRHSQPLELGALVTSQFCVGAYGKVARAQGEVVGFGDIRSPMGVYLRLSQPLSLPGVRGGASRHFEVGQTYCAFVDMRGGRAYGRHVDFEHGHESFVEVTGWAPGVIPRSLSGEKIAAMMKSRGLVPLEVADGMGITHRRLREVLANGVRDRAYALDWLEAMGVMQYTPEMNASVFEPCAQPERPRAR